MSDIKTPRFIELNEAISDAKERLEGIKPPYDFEEASSKVNLIRIDATSSTNTMWQRIEKLLAIKDAYPNSSAWFTVNAQGLSDEVNRFITIWDSYEHSAINNDINVYKKSLKTAADAITVAEQDLAQYLASQQYEIDCLKAQMAELTNKKK